MDVEPRDTCGASTALKVETTSHAAGNASRLLATDTPDEGRELQCLLHDAGLRVSRARVAVLLALATTPQATAVIVAARARRESGGVSMQAVYGRTYRPRRGRPRTTSRTSRIPDSVRASRVRAGEDRQL
jgi:hypothetical protein